MDAGMTADKWRELARATKFRMEQLQYDLEHENYSRVESVSCSKNRQIDAIRTLREQIPVEYING